MASGKIIHTTYRWEPGAMRLRSRTAKRRGEPEPGVGAGWLVRMNKDLQDRQRALARTLQKDDRQHLLGSIHPANGPKHGGELDKVATTSLGTFRVMSYNTAQDYNCERCSRATTAKIAVLWTDVAGTSGWICLRCYRELLADPLSKAKAPSRRKRRR